MHSCNPRSPEAEAGGSQEGESQPGLKSECNALSQKNKTKINQYNKTMAYDDLVQHSTNLI